MKKISFSYRGEKSRFRGCSLPAQTPAGFSLNEAWIDMEMGPFAHFAGLLILDSVAGAAGPRMGNLWGMECAGFLPGGLSYTGLEGDFSSGAGPAPASWRTPSGSGPWRVSSFHIRVLSTGGQVGGADIDS